MKLPVLTNGTYLKFERELYEAYGIAYYQDYKECPLVLLALPLLFSSGLKTMFRVLAAAETVR